MRLIKETLQLILAVYFAIIFLTAFLLLYPFFLLLLSTKSLHPYAHKARKLWGRLLFFFGGIWVKQIEETPVNWSQTYVVAANHTSYLDIPTLTVKLPTFISFMAKAELGKIPLFGIFFRTIDIAVDRKNVRHAAWAFHQAKELMIKDKRSIVIFPEGTIPAFAPKLGKFKEGAFRLAIETQMPILPISIIGNWIVLPDKGKLRFRPGKVIQYIHQPVPTIGLTLDDLEDLKQKVYRIIEQKLASYGYIQ
jgi:1-acyl-sn-glycerol-3-phosphate acyltransferase